MCVKEMLPDGQNKTEKDRNGEQRLIQPGGLILTDAVCRAASAHGEGGKKWNL